VEILRELWTKHKSAFLLAVAMACFLMAGILVRFLPKPPAANDASIVTAPAAVTNAAPATAAADAAAEAKDETPAPTNVIAEPIAPPEWFLYITGAVRKPGVYKLPEDSRLFQLVEAAEGLTGFADAEAVNLAAPLEDGMHVHIPRKGERAAERSLVGSPAAQERIFADIGARAPSARAKTRNGLAETRLIDVNRATAEELNALKGIGPALAGRIVAYRQAHGRFRAAEDLLRVSGIGPKKLEGFRKNITVNP
jgi:competence protein ComEA